MNLFGQTPKEFFKSKSNWTGLTAIIMSSTTYYTGKIELDMAIQGILGGLALISIKDAMAKK
jgi:hypothetical protein